MTMLVSDLRNSVTNFRAWWFAELAASFPAAWRARFLHRAGTLVARLSDDKLVLCGVKGGQEQTIAALDRGVLSIAALRQSAAKSGHAFRPGRDAVQLRLDTGQVLRRRVTLPAAAAEDVRGVLSFEMDRQTPYRAGDVYFDFRVVAADREAKTVSVDLVVIRRSKLDDMLSALADCGLKPSQVGIDNDTPTNGNRFNLLPSVPVGSASRWGGRLAAGLAAIAIGLGVTFVWLRFEQQHQLIAAYETAIEEARAASVEAQELRTEATKLLEQSKYVVVQKRTHPLFVEILDEVTRLLPDDTWLLQLRMEDGQIAMAGYSSEASALVAKLEDSALLSEVRFGSPVTLDPRLLLERFNLSATIVERSQP